MSEKCRICGGLSKDIFDAKILRKYQIKYYHCNICGFLQTEKPYWLAESYSEAIRSEDTGIILRNQALAKQIPVILYYFFNYKNHFLDYAAGYGILVRMMRDSGFDFYWADKYSDNIFAREFEYKNNLQKNIELITTFESFEHFESPLEDIEKMISISKNILFTTELLPEKIPNPNEWWYYALSSGQHISFYSRKTLKFIAKKYNLFFYSNGFLHLFTHKNLEVKSNLPIINKLELLFRKDIFSFITSLYKKKHIKKIIRKKLNSKTMKDHLLISQI